IGGYGEPLDGQAHARRHVAGEYIAEVSGRHREGDLAVRGAERDGGDEIIDRLRGDAGEVDGVDAGEPDPVAEHLVTEHGLYERLAVVERAFNCDGVNIVVT